MKQYVIIGNGIAAASCIEGIRSIDTEGKITVISEENHPVYCRPLISYYLEGKTDSEHMNYRSSDFYDKMDCQVIYGKKAEKIDSSAKRIILDDGTLIPYTSTCIATGSSSFIPEFEGIETVENKFSFMTMDDTLALESVVNKNSKVLIIGAGLIGLKCAEGLKNRVAKITVCDLADRVLSSILDKECADIMQTHLEANGIEFILDDTVQNFDKNIATMKSGKTVEFDVLVLAVGVRANIELIKDIGGNFNRGIIIDTKMQTSIEGIYAAGDCTESVDISSGEKKVLALLPNANMQGKCAGVNMAGGNETFEKAIPMNSIGFFGMHAMTAGSYYTEAEGGEVFEVKCGDSLKRLFTKEGYLTGFIIIGNTERAGIYTSLIIERTPLETVDFEMLKLHATSMAFSPEIRRNKFGGVV
ncbi:MAG: NAD(P)/FAD-dependent oxidoreductase [Ruminococcus sp.]|nr:NAD(P)/FAD-dependent oxidoreductase [Ruminococcus sp.]